MLVTVDGIVIGRRTIGENNCFLDVLTEEYGVIEATAHGIKKLTSKNAGACGLFSYSRFCFAKSGVRYTLNSAEPKHSFYEIATDLEALSLAVYFSEVLKATSAAEQAADGLLRFAAISFYEVEKRRIPLAQTKAVFELRLAELLGFSPDLRVCRSCLCYEHEEMYFSPRGGWLICGDCRREADASADELFLLPPPLLYAARYILYSPTEKIYRFTLNRENLDRLSALAERFLLLHLDRDFKSLDYYRAIKI
ncbi:MAG: DNA repair protein RecO [Bacteroides sp.]|nr:DNA repair protein RecO [Eubacterium sp.]MCM1417920.1 DNA repair protein RecO [Roseburia sp.]MCM1461917.1 DNA repair protein RecO [Bacteroides sp.]